MNKVKQFIAALTVCAVANTAWGQSEAFTYQGQLKLHGVPLSEQVDMKFTLFDSKSATEAVASPVIFDGTPFSSIQVKNGLFSAELDFGPGALQLGQWIEIEVRSPHDPTDATPYTPLSPRQRISAAPFALNVPGLASTQAGVEVDGDVHALGEVAASAYTSNSPFIIKVKPLNMECARFDEANCFMGVGTDAPQAKLHIGGVAGVDGLMFPDGSLQKSAAIGGGGGVSGSGTTNTIPLWSAGTMLGNSLIAQSNGVVRLPNVVTLAVGAQGTQTSFGSPNGETGMSMTGPSGRADFRFDGTTLRLFNGPAGTPPANGIAINASGNVGMGTTNPVSRLDIAAQDGLGITGYQPFLTLRDSNAGNARGRIQTAAGSMFFYTESSFATGNPPLSVLNSGRVKVNILEVAGADVAEKFPSNDKNVEPGTVMEIDPENPGKLRIAHDAYSARVAGVVSGAGDIPVGAILGNLPGHENSPAIALSGRVWVQCDAGTGSIVAGDLLTTSCSPGYAMKASDRERSHGAVLGKAMTALAQGERGLVLVLVNLQ